MQQSLIHIFLSSAIICLLLAVGFLASKKLQVLPARLLGMIYMVCAAQNFLAFVVFDFGWEFAALLRASLAMTLGPGIYFYYSSLVGSDGAKYNRWLLHLIPAALVLSLGLLRAPVLWLMDYLIIGSFAVYLVFTCKLLKDGQQRLEHLGPYAQTAYRWLFILALLMTINLIIEILIFLELRSGIALHQSWALHLGATTFLLFHAITLLLVITRAPLIEWMHALQDLRISKTKLISDAEARDIFDRWETMVIARELFKKDGGVTLEQAGRMMVIPARQISQAINRIYGSSFSQYLNDCRVKAAQIMLSDNKEMPITTVMMEAGFSTKSNFNKEFLRVTGLSPSEYRKQIFPE